MNRRDRSLQARLLRYGTIGLCVLAIVGLSTIFFVRNVVRESAHAELTSFARLQAERIESQLDLTAEAMHAMASAPELLEAIRASDASAVGRQLVEAPAKMRDVAAVSVFLPDGSKLADSGGDSRYPPHPVSAALLAEAGERFRTGRGMFLGPAFKARDGSGRYLHVAAVGQQEYSFAAIMVVEGHMRSIERIVETSAMDDRSLDMHLVQRNGANVEFVTNVRFAADSRFNLTVPMTSVGSPAVQALLGGDGLLTGARDYRGRTVIAAVRTLPTTPWGLVVKLDQAEAYRPISRVVGGVATAFIMSALFMIAGYLVLTRTLTARIRRVTQSATAISRGALGTRIGDRSPDELGSLARAFDRMADNLVSDRNKREQIEGELSRRAWSDQLTGLPNRAFFYERLGAAMSSTDRRSGTIGMLFCDLDEFKEVNDELGHSAGDLLLRSVADRFRSLLRSNELLARFGGDEFVVLCTGLTDAPRQTAAVAQRLRDSLREPIPLGDREARTSVSIGIAIATAQATSESLIRDADVAMYRAKSAERTKSGVTEQELNHTNAQRLASRANLRRAIDSGAFTVVFQPVVDLGTGDTIGYEALSRWPREDGVAMPADFVPLAEELGLSGMLDRWVIDAACRAITTRPGFSVSVNVSLASLSSTAIAEDVINLVARHGIQPSALTLEISERDLLADTDDADVVRTMAQLQHYGITLALDDFGVGLASITRLHRWPIGAIKLDAGLVAGLAVSERARATCASLIRLGGDLGVRVIAEGVEHPDQYRILRELGCATAQGFLFGRPDVLAVIG